MATWPFRFASTVDKTFSDWFARKLRRFEHKYRHSKVLRPVASALLWLLALPLRALTFVMALPFRGAGAVYAMLSKSREKREIGHLLQGVPALLALPIAVVLLVMLRLRTAELPQDYRAAAFQSYRDGRYAESELYFDRLLRLGVDDEETTLALAQSLEKSGQTARAAAIFGLLAPEDRIGNPEAHLWQATRLIEQKSTFESEQRLRSLYRHLQIAERHRPDDPSVNFHLARLSLMQRDFERGLQYLEVAARERPELLFDLAVLYRNLSQDGPADSRFRRALPIYEAKLKAAPGDTTARLNLAEIFFQLQDYEASSRVLQEGIQLEPDGPFQSALSLAFVRRFDQLARDAVADPTLLLDLLRKALALDPKSKEAIQRLLKFGEVAVSDRTAEQQARDLLESMIAVGESAALAHFALGIRAWTEKNTEESLFHLERAYKLDPSLATLGNNLAHLLAHQEEPDYDRALQLINSVLEQHPDVPAYRETRGQILARMERWQEALDDLEAILPHYQRNIPVHETLAVVYRHLGRETLAAKHELAARTLKGKIAN